MNSSVSLCLWILFLCHCFWNVVIHAQVVELIWITSSALHCTRLNFNLHCRRISREQRICRRKLVLYDKWKLYCTKCCFKNPLVSRQTDCSLVFVQQTNVYHPLPKSLIWSAGECTFEPIPVVQYENGPFSRSSSVSRKLCLFYYHLLWCFSWIGELDPAVVSSSHVPCTIYHRTCSVLVLPCQKLACACTRGRRQSFFAGKKYWKECFKGIELLLICHKLIYDK